MRLLTLCIEREVSQTGEGSNLFRRNSVAPKLLSLYAFDDNVGGAYLLQVLQPIIDRVSQRMCMWDVRGCVQCAPTDGVVMHASMRDALF